MIPVGFALQPDMEFLALVEPLLLEDADFYEVAPETLWFEDESGILRTNGFHRAFLELKEETNRPFVAHGVGLSLGSDNEGSERTRRWLARIADDQRRFGFLWYTDHLGVTIPAGCNLALPLPLPMTDGSAEVVSRSLRALRSVVPEAGLENTAQYFLFGRALEEPAFLRKILGESFWLLLDLHNLFATARNLGFDAGDWLDLAPLERVIEIHLAGGRESPPEWLPSRRSLRLDGHDASIPEEVWSLLASTIPRCPNLRGIVIERMEGSIAEADVSMLRHEMARARAAVTVR